MDIIFEDYKVLIKKYFKIENKFEMYNELYSFLKKTEKELFILKLDKMNNKFFFVNKLKEIYLKIKSIINLLSELAYKKWIKEENKKTIILNIGHKKIEVYERYLDYKIISSEDPFTEDEKKYCLFISNKMSNNRYINFEDIPLNIINLIIKGLK